jgi:hypothetical protein
VQEEEEPSPPEELLPELGQMRGTGIMLHPISIIPEATGFQQHAKSSAAKILGALVAISTLACA